MEAVSVCIFYYDGHVHFRQLLLHCFRGVANKDTYLSIVAYETWLMQTADSLMASSA